MNNRITLQGVKGDSVCFEPLTEISSVTCQVTSCIGRRTLSDNLPLLAVESFCAALRTLAETGLGEAVLDGAYDFRLVIGRTPAQRHYWAELYQADFILLDNLEHGRLAISGGFYVDHGDLTQFAEAFTGHFAPQ